MGPRLRLLKGYAFSGIARKMERQPDRTGVDERARKSAGRQKRSENGRRSISWVQVDGGCVDRSR
jgi:hypothetical protein